MPDDREARDELSASDRPSVVLDRASYPNVETAHIVPRMYQKAFAVEGKVAVHQKGDLDCVLRSTKTAGTRSAFYRRARPDGEPIDDVEACLAVVEDKAAPPLKDLVSGGALTVERKGILAQFLALQMLRGPTFFQHRADLLATMIGAFEAEHFTPEGLAAAGGDIEVARRRLLEKYLAPTQALLDLLSRSQKLASILGVMRWSTIRFDQPALAYSDHPVVMWPMDKTKAQALKGQQFGPISALELRVPLAPDAALMMDWVDRPDQHNVSLDKSAAAALNASTVAQADREWMHRPGAEPEIASGPLEPLSRLLDPAYDRDAFLQSARRSRAQQFLARVQGRAFVPAVEILTDLGSPA